MRIDSHQHFWKFDPLRDAWITEDMATIRRDFIPEDLIREMRVNNIDGCIAVQADQSEQETRFLLDLASRHREVVGVVGWVDLRAANVGEALQQYVNCRKFRGVRHIVQSEADDRFMLNRE